MAIITNFYTVDEQAGTNLNQPQTISVTTNPEIPGPNSVLGDICQGIGGSQWVFVQASATITALNCIAFDESFQAKNAVCATASSTLTKTLAIAEFQASVAGPGDYFWAALACRGGALVNVQSTAAAGVQMYLSSSTPGALTTTLVSTTTNALIYGAIVVGALVSATAAVEVIFTNLRTSN